MENMQTKLDRMYAILSAGDRLRDPSYCFQTLCREIEADEGDFNRFLLGELGMNGPEIMDIFRRDLICICQ